MRGCADLFHFGDLVLTVLNDISNHDAGVVRRDTERFRRNQPEVELEARVRVPPVAQEIARRLGGTVRPAQKGSYPPVDFILEGRPAEIEWGMDRPYTRVLVNLSGTSAGLLQIYPENADRDLTRKFEGKLVRVGHRGIEQRFVLRSTPEGLASRLFKPERREALFSHIRRMPRWWEGRITLLNDETLVVFLPICLWKEASVLNLVGFVTAFVAALREEGWGVGVTWLDHRSEPGGICQVCGTGMSEGIVLCARCRTPHHGQCWRYLERCSTFACDGTSSVPA